MKPLWSPNITINNCCSVTQLRLTLCNPMQCSMPGFPVLHHLPELAQTYVHWVGDAIHHLILCRLLLLLPSVFPRNRVFSNESALLIRWSKYWNFSFSNNPSNEYSRLISCGTNWFDLLAVQGTLKNCPCYAKNQDQYVRVAKETKCPPLA